MDPLEQRGCIAMDSKLLFLPPAEDGHELDLRLPSPAGTQPFDLSELDRLPQPTEDDPPYRPWWVVDKP